MVRFDCLVCFAGALGVATPALAQEVGDVTLGSGLSIFGATVEGTYQLEGDVRLRGVAIGGLSYSETQEDDGNVFDLNADVSAAALLFDYYPDGYGWRFSGGFFVDMSDLSGTGRGADDAPIEVNGETFAAGVVNGDASFGNRFAPMVATGYEWTLAEDWALSTEFGAILTGGIDLTYDANYDELEDAVAEDPDFQDAVTTADDVRVLPYLSMAVHFRF